MSDLTLFLGILIGAVLASVIWACALLYVANRDDRDPPTFYGDQR